MGRKIRYISLMKNFGGTITDWKKQTETDLQIYDYLALCLNRKRRMEEETQKAMMRNRRW